MENSISNKLLSKNRVTIPQSIVNLLSIQPGDKLYFTPESDGSFKVTTYEPNIEKTKTNHKAIWTINNDLEKINAKHNHHETLSTISDKIKYHF